MNSEHPAVVVATAGDDSWFADAATGGAHDNGAPSGPRTARGAAALPVEPVAPRRNARRRVQEPGLVAPRYARTHAAPRGRGRGTRLAGVGALVLVLVIVVAVVISPPRSHPQRPGVARHAAIASSRVAPGPAGHPPAAVTHNAASLLLSPITAAPAPKAAAAVARPRAHHHAKRRTPPVPAPAAAAPPPAPPVVSPALAPAPARAVEAPAAAAPVHAPPHRSAPASPGRDPSYTPGDLVP